MNFFKKIFHRKREKRDEPQPRPLRIEGTKTSLTPKPDDAELAAQALLETSSHHPSSPRGGTFPSEEKEGDRGVAYYRDLSRKIQNARQQERRAAMRYVAYVEEQLAHWGQAPCNPASPAHTGDSPRSGQGVGLIERELYKRQDVVEREGGELLKRWRHCLAEVIVRQMTLSNDNNDNNDNSDSSDNGGGGTPGGID